MILTPTDWPRNARGWASLPRLTGIPRTARAAATSSTSRRSTTIACRLARMGIRGEWRCRLLQPLDDGHIGLAAAFTHGLQAIALAACMQRMHQRRHQPRAGRAERMAQRDRAAVDVEARRVGASGLQPGHRD